MASSLQAKKVLVCGDACTELVQELLQQERQVIITLVAPHCDKEKLDTWYDEQATSSKIHNLTIWYGFFSKQVWDPGESLKRLQELLVGTQVVLCATKKEQADQFAGWVCQQAREHHVDVRIIIDSPQEILRKLVV